MPKNKNNTFYDGLGLIALGAVFYYFSLQISMQFWDPSTISPRAFPYALAAGFVILGVILCITGWMQQKHEDVPAKTPRTAQNSITFTLGAKVLIVHPVLFTLVMCLALFFAWKSVGFLVSASVFLVTMLYKFKTSVVKSLIIGIGLAIFIYVTFYYGFQVRLPAGILDGIL